MESKILEWERFENRVRDFLRDLHFDSDSLDGGKRFSINNIQIDAIAGHEKTLFVIECTTRRRLRNKIQELKGSIRIIKEGIAEHAVYGRYTNVHFVIATNGRHVISEDQLFSQLEPRIFLWDGSFLDYYENLYKIIGEYAKYNLLGEMDVGPSDESPIEILAIKAKMREFPVYQFFVKPRRLLKH
jgi:hypothetical protein